MFNKVKITLVGPCEAGKTTLANFLAEATETTSGEYRPTQGARILEFEMDDLNTGPNRSSSVEVELWDCSGNHSFEMCWPAIQKGNNGVVLVFDPAKPSQEKELENWYLHFVKEAGLKEKQCVILAHKRQGSDEQVKKKLAGSLARIKVVSAQLDDEPEAVRSNFRSFVSDVFSGLKDRSDAEELSIID